MSNIFKAFMYVIFLEKEIFYCFIDIISACILLDNV